MTIPSPKLVLSTVVSTVIWIVLALLGTGGISPWLHRPEFACTALVTFALSITGLFSGGNISAGVREDRGNRWVLAAFGVVGVASTILPPYLDRIGWWPMPGESLRWIGVGLYVAGGVLRLWPVFVLGHRFSGLVAIQANHTLVTDGIYARVRNPSYVGLLVILLGWSLVFRSWAGVVLTALTVIPLVARIRAEERLLHDQFGAEYDAYRARTWRLVPGIY